MGILFGGFDILHDETVLIVACTLSFLSAFLLPILPDMIKRKMPDEDNQKC